MMDFVLKMMDYPQAKPEFINPNEYSHPFGSTEALDRERFPSSLHTILGLRTLFDSSISTQFGSICCCFASTSAQFPVGNCQGSLPQDILSSQESGWQRQAMLFCGTTG